MAFNRAKFLIQLLGADGARALAKASDRSEALGDVLVPRTIVAWLRANDAYDGEIPGSDQHCAFVKSEKGFTGNVQMEPDFDYHFRNAPLTHVAGAIAVAMGMGSASVPDEVRRLDLEKLGKNVDLMVKSEQGKQVKVSAGQSRPEESSAGDAHGEASRQEIYQKAEKAECKICGGKGGKHNDRLVGGLVLKCRNANKELAKAALNPGGGAGGKPGTGTAAGPIAPAAPTAPTATAPTPSIKQNVTKPVASAKPPGAPTTVKLARSEAEYRCAICSTPQFQGDRLLGCMCVRELCKSAQVVSASPAQITISVNGWSKDDLATFLEAVGRGEKK